jgi:uncharacterized membrane protein
MKTFDSVLLLTWALNVYDIVVTLVGTMQLSATELNPLMRAALDAGPVFFVATKLSVHAAVGWVLARRLEKHPRKTWATLIVIMVLFLTVAVWNTAVLV